MTSRESKQSGFSIVEAVLVVVAVGVISAAGVFVYQHNRTRATYTTGSIQPQSNNKQTGTTQTSDPYTGWNSATLKYEKVSFKYPADWKISTTSTPNGLTGVVKPGSDQATLISPTGLTVNIQTGVTNIGDGPGYDVSSFVSNHPITTLGGTYYLDVYNSANVATLPTPGGKFPFSRYIVTTDGTGNVPYDAVFITPSDNQASNAPPDSIENDPSFGDAKLIIQSLSY